MATKKSTKTAGVTPDENIISQEIDKAEEQPIAEQPSQELTQLLEAIESMRNELSAISQENSDLKQQIKDMESKEVETAETISVPTMPTIPSSDKVKVYHMQELVGGTITFIKLTSTTRTLQHMGQVMNLDINDFEELEGRYRIYFDKGILAVGVENMDIANTYNLPIYDKETQRTYNAQTLKAVVNYTYEELQSFYNDLSEFNQTYFLNYWLGKVYSKETGYYNMEKLRWLNSISGTEIFSPILREMENVERRKTTQSIDGNKM